MTNITLALNYNILSISFYKFISLYIFAILIMLALVVAVSRHIRKTYYLKAIQQQIKISSPLQIAYLKNGIKGYIRTVLFKLVQDGYLELPRKSWFGYKVRTKVGHPPVKKLNKPEQTIYHYAVSTGHWDKIINHKELHEDLWEVKDDLGNQLTDYSLLYPQNVVNKLSKLRGFFILITLTLGSYRYFWGIDKVRANLGSLVLVGLLGVMLITHVAKLDRVTKQGQKYLKSLKKSYSDANPTKNKRYKLVLTSLLKVDKKEMSLMLKMLKTRQTNENFWMKMPHKYLNITPANSQLET